MNIYQSLKQDHDTASELIERLEATPKRARKKREQIFARLRDELLIHAQAEEAVFYAALSDDDATRNLVQEAREEHGRVEDLLDEIGETDPVDEEWLARIADLREQVDRYVEIEETELFAAARTVLDRHRVAQLALDFAEAKQRLAAERAPAGDDVRPIESPAARERGAES